MGMHITCHHQVNRLSLAVAVSWKAGASPEEPDFSNDVVQNEPVGQPDLGSICAVWGMPVRLLAAIGLSCLNWGPYSRSVGIVGDLGRLNCTI